MTESEENGLPAKARDSTSGSPLAQAHPHKHINVLAWSKTLMLCHPFQSQFSSLVPEGPEEFSTT